jgi:hypothetical protein
MHRAIAFRTTGRIYILISEQVPENPGKHQPDTMADKGDAPEENQ